MVAGNSRRGRSVVVLLSSAMLVVVPALTHTVSAASAATTGTISTFAGNGEADGDPGDNGPATSAKTNMPSATAVDAAGNVYIAELAGSRVRRVTAQGVISTVAGTGEYGSGPDGGQAKATTLKTPSGLAVDPAGNLYIADYYAARVRKVNPQGVISTVAGSGEPGYGGDGGPATSAKLDGPSGLALDQAGNLYIADTDNHRIRKVGTDLKISTVMGTDSAGSGADQLRFPKGVTADTIGRLFVADTGNHRIQKRAADGITSTLVGTGIAGSVKNQLNAPGGVAVDRGGNVHIADTGNHRVRVMGATPNTRAQAGSGTSGFSGDGGRATVAALTEPVAITLDADANLYIADQGNNRVRKVVGGPLISTVPGTDVFYQAKDVAVDAAGNLYIAEGGTARVHKLTPAGVRTTLFVGQTSSSMWLPIRGITADRAGVVYFADDFDHVVRRIGTDGAVTVVAGKVGAVGSTGDGGPATQALLGKSISDVTVDGTGNVYIWDADNAKVRKVDPNGVITTFAGSGTNGTTGDGGPAVAARLLSFGGQLAADSAGNVYITNHDHVRRVDRNGIITLFVGWSKNADEPVDNAPKSAGVSTLWGIATDSAGTVYLFEYTGQIRKIGADGIIRAVAGVGRFTGETAQGFYDEPNGDGGPALLARITTQQGMAIDAAGTLYVTDFVRVRRFSTL